MSIKKWLWNDNASDLVNRRGGGRVIDEQHLDAAREAVRKHAPMAKQITREAFKAAGMALGALASAAASTPSRKSDEDWWADATVTPLSDGYHASGPEGPGYYENGFKMGD
ncbi:MAG: hypothetical protein CMN25_00510 [Salinicola sp.]|uniref:hypothetical protein n=1 Tax=uncultured Salinicola sp. TaxID=1193542 RepID=UPI000C89D0FC|nr:hypothetical protein [uncultured Salinicola sp.]MAM55806.1 hypothetical protein [Salinicola sp.]|tara:strand:+ start:7209 stop:7541 length:333 start_codon:yes stop_codon:yes gene_type:complete